MQFAATREGSPRGRRRAFSLRAPGVCMGIFRVQTTAGTHQAIPQRRRAFQMRRKLMRRIVYVGIGLPYSLERRSWRDTPGRHAVCGAKRVCPRKSVSQRLGCGGSVAHDPVLPILASANLSRRDIPWPVLESRCTVSTLDTSPCILRHVDVADYPSCNVGGGGRQLAQAKFVESREKP